MYLASAIIDENASDLGIILESHRPRRPKGRAERRPYAREFYSTQHTRIAEGTKLKFLLARAPQLMSPWHVEAYVSAKGVETAGLRAALSGAPTTQAIGEIVHALSGDRVKRFAARAATFRAQETILVVIDDAELDFTATFETTDVEKAARGVAVWVRE